MYTRILFAGLTALSIFLGQSLVAGENPSNREHNVKRASKLNGMYVKAGQGEDAQTLGHVEDMVVNMRDGSIVYVAVGHGQTLGFGGKLFAVAPDAFRLSDNGEYLILNGVTEQDFANGKGFDANAWPTRPDQTWSRGEGKVQKAVKEAGRDVKEAVQGKDGNKLTRASAIIGMAVRTPQDKSLGNVYDLAVDCSNHKIAYAAINYGSTLGVGGKLIAVPWDRLQIKSLDLRPGSNVFVLNTTQEQMERAPNFTNENWPAQANEEFWSRVERNRDANNNRD
jgi:sporulation protein YlmC with PRC-barrel domain